MEMEHDSWFYSSWPDAKEATIGTFSTTWLAQTFSLAQSRDHFGLPFRHMLDAHAMTHYTTWCIEVSSFETEAMTH